jgi:hypothetical protein
MAWTEKDMYPSTAKVLRRRYPAYDGWIIYPKDRWMGYEADFVVERKRRGRTERVVVEVKTTCKVRQGDVNQLNLYVRNLSGGKIKIVDKIMVIPSGGDVGNVPPDVQIVRLRNFKCENGDIVWYC